jgi:hypothetical protein
VRGGGAWLCAAEVHGSHALESCGLLEVVRLESRRIETKAVTSAVTRATNRAYCKFSGARALLSSKSSYGGIETKAVTISQLPMLDGGHALS